MKDLGVVLATARPLDLYLGHDAVLARTARAHDLVNTGPIGPVLDDQCGVSSHFVNVGTRQTRVRSSVFVLQIRDLERVLVEWVLDEATF